MAKTKQPVIVAGPLFGCTATLLQSRRLYWRYGKQAFALQRWSRREECALLLVAVPQTTMCW
jgi:hypothetical protein